MKSRFSCLLRAVATLAVTLGLTLAPAEAAELNEPTNFFGETGSLLDHADPLLDDRGPGFYTYPLDRRIERGMFDIERFTVYEEGQMVTFTIQMRRPILTRWPSGGSDRGEDQGFVGLLFDIYLDTDRRPGSGFKQALPGRDIEFADEMGWDKVILVTPLSHSVVWNILNEKSDDELLRKMVPGIVIPDYMEIQHNRLIIRINKEFIGQPTKEWGYQLFAMGFTQTVSVNQLWNRDVQGFANQKDFGGGWDTHGDPKPIDLIVPEGQDQYELLRQYRSEPFRNKAMYAKVPFVYGPKASKGPLKEPLSPLGGNRSVDLGKLANEAPAAPYTAPKPGRVQPPIARQLPPPTYEPAAPIVLTAPAPLPPGFEDPRPIAKPVSPPMIRTTPASTAKTQATVIGQDSYDVYTPPAQVKKPVKAPAATAKTLPKPGFQPAKVASDGFQPLLKLPSGFVPMTPTKGASK